VPEEAIQQIIGGYLPMPTTTINNYDTQNGQEFAAVKIVP
jgi:hypothetical protein